MIIKPRPLKKIEKNNENVELDFFEKPARIDLPWKDVVFKYKTLFKLLKMGGEPTITHEDISSALKMLSSLKKNKNYVIEEMESWEKRLEKYLSSNNDDDENDSNDGDSNDNDDDESENDYQNNDYDNNDDDQNENDDNPRDELNSHYYLRQNARHNVQIYTEKMKNFMLKKNNTKRKREFSVGDCVRLLIPKVDKQPLDHNYLLCKIIKKYDNDIYQLACKSGIINVGFPAAELELLENRDVPELYMMPTRKISIREASRLQNVIIRNNNSMNDNENNNSDDNNNQNNVGSNNRICNCKKNNCNTRTCPCKKHNTICTSSCHKGRVCLNKNI
jgi:hypothetical protein